jgi:hypothetical protein
MTDTTGLPSAARRRASHALDEIDAASAGCQLVTKPIRSESRDREEEMDGTRARIDRHGR